MIKRYSIILFLVFNISQAQCQWTNTGMPFYRIYMAIGDTIYVGPEPAAICSVFKGTGNGLWESFIDSSLHIPYMYSDEARQQFSLSYKMPDGTPVNQVRFVGENRVVNIANTLNRTFSIDGNRMGVKTYGPLYLSSDTGATWQSIVLPLANSYYSGSCILKDSIVLVSSRWPDQGYPEWLYISKDYGQTFTEIAEDGWFSILKIIEDRIFLSDGLHLYRSEDLGATWEDISFNGVTYSDLAYKNGILLLGTGHDGIWASTDLGDHWKNFSSGLSTPYHPIDVAITDSYYFAIVPYYASFWQRPIADMQSVLVTESDNVSVYPNPVHDIIYISMEEQIINAYAEITGLTGNVLYSEKLLLNGKKARIPVSNLKPGVYLLRITTEEDVYCEKFVKQ